jgi:Flp pilus assembly protein TadG
MSMKTVINTVLRPGAACARLRTLAAEFRLNKRANVAMITALTAIPLISAVGCAIDYSYASMIKTKLQAAADAATLGTVSNNSPVVTTAKAMTGNGTVSGGSTYAQNFFTADIPGFASVTNSETVTKTGMVVTATVNYSYSVPTYFMKVIGYNNVTVSGSSTASFTLPTYINFYLMLDVSGSMSFPSTPSEQARLMAVNPDNNLGNPGYPQGCQFACHFQAQGACAQTGTQVYQGPIPAVGHSYHGYIPNPSPGGYCQGFTISRLGTTPTSFTSGTNAQNGGNVNWTNTAVSSCPNPGTTSCIQLQADAVGYGVTTLLQTAVAEETYTGISNEFQIGLFPFIRWLCTSSASSSNSCSVGLTSSIGTGSTISNFAANLASLLDTGQDATLGSGGTHFENALPEMNTFITSIGTGTSPTNALPYVFIVTDGSQDYQYESGGGWGSENYTASTNVPYQNSSTTIPQNPASPNNRNDQTGGPNATDWCGTMKARGITIAILYIPYQPISDPSTIFDDEDGYANTNASSTTNYIPKALASCASPNFLYTATSPTAIQTDLQEMFQQSLSTAHIAQ